MKLVLAAVGRLKAGPERELFDRYAERAAALAPKIGVAGVQFREFEESRARDANQRKAEEGRALIEAAGRDSFLCVLDERGAARTSAAWAEEIGWARDAAQNYVLVIGGPDGLAPEVREAARAQVAFGAMTWPHQLVRVMAAEQIYRCFAILGRLPYHRA